MTKDNLRFRTSLHSRITSPPPVTDLLDALRRPTARKLFASCKKLALETKARLQNKIFYCNALQGMSTYNISVNCDMTVSCNCQDDYGEGILGDLSRTSFSDIFGGPAANAIRAKLAEGILPLRTCSRCFELRTVTKAQAPHARGRRAAPQGIMVENTSECNLHCVACNRTSIAADRRTRRMSMDDIRIVSSTIRDNGIKRIHFFKYGEPFLSPTVYEELKIIKEQNPEVIIVISTNGAAINTRERRDAALLADHIYFSIDGVSDETLTRYQRGGSFAKAFGNMREVIRLRNARGQKLPFVEWKYVLFNWNDRPHMLAAAKALAKEAGVDVISFCPTNAPYYGKSWRFYVSPFFKKETVKRWNVREIRFSETERV